MAPKQSTAMPISQFSHECLRIVEDVASTRRRYIITREGEPVAKLVPIEYSDTINLEGSVQYEGDIVSPTGEHWNADS